MPHHARRRLAFVIASSSALPAAGGALSAHADVPSLPPEWIVYEQGPTAHAEEPQEIVHGPDGSVTVLGSAYLPATNYDILVIRYDAEGAIDWHRRYDTPSHGSDRPGGIAAAPDGGVWFAAIHNLADRRYVAVTRLDADGEIVWSEERDLTSATQILGDVVPCLAVDLAHGAPRIYLTVADADLYRVLRFDDTGEEEWDVHWKSERALGQLPQDIDVGVSGNVYVTGRIHEALEQAYGTIGISPEGDVLWSHMEGGDIGSTLTDPFVRAHPDGGAVVSASPETFCGVFEMRVWSIADDGAERWNVTDGGAPCGPTFGPAALAVAADGRVAVSATNISPSAWRTLMLDGDGRELWERVWPNPITSGDQPGAIAFDAHGGVIIAGRRPFSPSADAFGILRYDAEGIESWQWSTPNPTAGMGRSIAFGTNGACYVTAQNWGGSGVGDRIATLRFDPPQPPCVGDLNGSGVVDGSDLAIVLGAWGSCSGCAADINGDGVVDGNDLAILLGAWGGC